MAKKKILILSVSAGAGHVRAAEAIRAYCQEADVDIEATHFDVMDYVPAGFRKTYTDFYITLVNEAPAVWGYLYHATNEAKPDSRAEKVRRGLERLNTMALRKAIVDISPDVIICTHFLPAEILSRMIRKERIQAPVWVQVTDFDLHRMWVHEHMTGYFVANDEVAYRLRAYGEGMKRIQVTGIPIMPAFSKSMNREQCTQALELDPAKTTFLLMGGGAGLGGLANVAEHLLMLRDDFQLIVLTGRNTEALESLKVLAERYLHRLVAVGFTSTVEQIMACADVVITKPGGLTSSECLAMGLPMIINAPIPGQEERNADYLLEHGAALKAFDPMSLAYRVTYLLEHPEKLRDMRDKARQLGKPFAGKDVIACVLEQC